MSGFEVQEPILNSPYEEPREHWRIVEAKSRNASQVEDLPCISTGRRVRPSQAAPSARRSS